MARVYASSRETAVRTVIVFSLLLLMCSHLGCAERSVPPFVAPSEPEWQIVKEAAGNVDDDPEPEYVLVLQKRDEKEEPEENTRIRIFDFAHDTNTWAATEIKNEREESELGLFYSGTTAALTDVTNDGRLEIVIEAWMCSGNGSTACLGLIVLAKRGRYFRQLFYSSDGAPQLKDLDGDIVREVLIHGEYRGPLTEDEAILYPLQVFKYDGQTYRRAPNSQFATYFDAELTRSIAEYEHARSRLTQEALTETDTLTLFRPLMVMLTSFIAKDDLNGMKQRYLSEEEFLKSRLPKAHLKAVEEFVLSSERESAIR